MKTVVIHSYQTSMSQSNFCTGRIAINTFTILRTVVPVSGHCPFPIEGTDFDGFEFKMLARASWIEGEMDDIVYSPVKDDWIELRYFKPGMDPGSAESVEAHAVDEEFITQEELARRAGDFTAFKLCSLLYEEEAEQQVWNNLLAREYEEQVVIERLPSNQ